MEVFVGVAETGSFAGAATRLSLPRSTVTRAVKALEAHLGATLIQRTTRRFALTPAGAIYLERARRAIRDIREAEAEVAGDPGSPRGTVRVNTTPSIATHLLVPALTGFHERFPDIRLRIATSDRLVDVIGGGFDCVIRAGEPPDSTSLVAKRLGSFRWILCAAPSYLERFGEPHTPEDLHVHRAVGYVASSPHVPSFESKSGPWLVVDETDAYIAAAVHGVGLIRAADFLLRPYLERGSLRELSVDAIARETPLYFMYAHAITPPPALLALRDWVQDRCTIAPERDRVR